MNWAVTYMLLTLLGFALNLLAAMPFTMSYYIPVSYTHLPLVKSPHGDGREAGCEGCGTGTGRGKKSS